MRYSPHVLVAKTPSRLRHSRVHVKSSSRQVSPVERRLHEKRLLAKIIETKKRRLKLEQIYKIYLKFVKALENELRIQEREVQNALDKLMQILASEETSEGSKHYGILLEAGDTVTDISGLHPLDTEELCPLSDSTLSPQTLSNRNYLASTLDPLK
ncbi:unnamed protein product [Haemonchus placei]|uniref:Charged multivesicular body protein 6 n=1 Tax=Haemonchus placei TaxID=6290 RepID=A0A0N4WH14_HAEPC|nr:unnamed protein product [Haemonchus placei]